MNWLAFLELIFKSNSTTVKMRGILLVKNNERSFLPKKQQEDYDQWALPSYELALNHNIAIGLALADVYFTLKFWL